ncbi:putative septation inhibitor protein [Actinobaculum suis]|uniref:Cell division protein CrgA n=1 Tax=Actinobaculum suis TaxID=1657 RepID=A0A7Z8Y7B8_9ACTO|nr:cell division protein CrgA [Actinobaculum suis]VDG75386.1 putative septation inhibitor protein [Actinobaculum suis]
MARTDDLDSELSTPATEAVDEQGEVTETRRRSKTRHRRTVRASEKRRPGTKADQEKRAQAEKEAASEPKVPRGKRRSPSWWAPVMCTLMIVGLIFIVVAYVSGLAFPIPGIGQGNLFIGFGVLIVGFLMTMGWR